MRSNFNGQSGLVYTRGENDLVAQGEFRDNGQQAGTRSAPYGIYVLADAGEGKGLRIIEPDVDASPTVTDTQGITYLPGATSTVPASTRYDVNFAYTHQYQFIARNPNLYHVGQFITVPGSQTGGTDAVGKIVDISADILTIVFVGPRTFAANSNLRTLTGTGTTNGTTLTGSGTLFATEVDFPMYLKSGSEYRRIVYVTSNTTAIIDSPFASNLSGAPLEVIKADGVTGFFKPTRGVVINGGVTVGPLLLRDPKAKNVPNDVSYLSFAGLDTGSRFDVDYALTMTGTALANSIVSGLPRYSQVQNVRCIFTSNITGMTGSAEIQIREGGTNKKTAITGFAALTSGTVTHGPTPDAPAFTAAGGGDVYFVSGSGNPSGSLTARLTIAKHAWAG